MAGDEATASAPVADLDSDGLVGDFPAGRRLVGTRCDQCGAAMIGTRVVCSACVSQAVSRIALPATGVLYSFTRLHGLGGAGVRPVGYVDLDLESGGGVRTLADLREGTVPLRPDMRVVFGVDGDDWFFTPAESAHEAGGSHE
jgi:uncharacterized OB-fold protein